MNAELKAKWAEALRSGRYKQGINWLRKDDSFCCLGVLCDIDGMDEWVPRFDSAVMIYAGRTGLLPDAIQKKADISTQEMEALINMNDGRATFPEIASYIEANL